MIELILMPLILFSAYLGEDVDWDPWLECLQVNVISLLNNLLNCSSAIVYLKLSWLLWVFSFCLVLCCDILTRLPWLFFQDPVNFNSKRIVLFRTWSKCAFSLNALGIELFHFRKFLIGDSSSVEISFLFPLSIAHSEQLLLTVQYRRQFAISI